MVFDKAGALRDLSFTILTFLGVIYRTAAITDVRLCVEYLDSSDCSSSSSTWAIDTPFLKITHEVEVTETSPSFNIDYQIILQNNTRIPLCSFRYLSSGECTNVTKTSCINCTNNYSTNSTVVAILDITDINAAKNGSRLVYDISRAFIDDRELQDFVISECPKSVGSASAVNVSSNPCGYNCTGKFSCSRGEVSPLTTFRCTEKAKWSPTEPTCIAEPTTTETVIAPTAPATSHGFTQGDGVFFSNSGPSFAAIGGVLAAICIGVFVYMAACTEIPYNVVLYIMFAICICVWAVALGLCFGLSTNKSAVIAGIVLGSLELAGMVVVIVFQFLHIKSHKKKGIPGKPEDTSL